MVNYLQLNKYVLYFLLNFFFIGYSQSKILDNKTVLYMTRYCLKKIWDFRRSGDTFTYIHTIQLYLQGTRRRFTQRREALVQRPRVAHSTLGPGTAITESTPARSEALRWPINICTTRTHAARGSSAPLDGLHGASEGAGGARRD